MSNREALISDNVVIYSTTPSVGPWYITYYVSKENKRKRKFENSIWIRFINYYIF